MYSLAGLKKNGISMTKKEFIWLIIRFFGIVFLITSFDSILKAVVSLVCLLWILPSSTPSGFVASLLFLGVLLGSGINIIVIIYLLFFGKRIAIIVHHTSATELENTLRTEDYPEIFMRFLGIWWLWNVIRQVLRLITGILGYFVLSNPQWFPGNNTSTNQNFMETLYPKLQSLQEGIFWSILLNMLIYGVLAWYFLKHGKFLINLLNRLRLKKETA